MQTSQMQTSGPATSFRTTSCLRSQNEHCSEFRRSPCFGCTVLGPSRRCATTLCSWPYRDANIERSIGAAAALAWVATAPTPQLHRFPPLARPKLLDRDLEQDVVIHDLAGRHRHASADPNVPLLFQLRTEGAA